MNKEGDLITIIVPIYKVEDYLNKCIESIRKQTYQNIEIILVDDGSPDKCPQICDKYSEIDERIRVIHQVNGGLSSARNRGIDIAKGKFIGFVDSDDYIEPTMFERLYDGIQRYDCDIAICRHYVEVKDKLLIDMPPVDRECVYDSKIANQYLIEDKAIRSYAWDKLYKAELFHKIRFPVGRNYEDIATTYKLFDQAKVICQLQSYEYYYQIRENCISDNRSIDKWYKNCRDIVISMSERYEYFSNKRDLKLKELSFAKLVPYLITYMKLGYQLRSYHDLDHYKQFLKKHKEEISRNPYISKKNKTIALCLTYPNTICSIGIPIMDRMKKVSMIGKVYHKVNDFILIRKKFDFSLQQGKKLRLFLFETPCFDNMGDHAIAYAGKMFFEKLTQEIPEIQIIEVSGWDTLMAVRQLKKEKRKNDVFICQGGGNMGNLYLFAEEFRRKIMKAFSDHVIIVFPQTIFFTEDKHGLRELEKSKKIYNRCSKLTLLARDQVSYDRMKKSFKCRVIPMVDVVTSIDATEYAAKKREGSIICLRSDKESALSKEDNKKIRIICEQFFLNSLITDTVTLEDINVEERDDALKAKWSLFGKAEMVVTDRLHGMIFSLITGTPCIVLGNNHHKVKETYNTLAKCDYLYYVDSIDEVASTIEKIKNKAMPASITRFDDEFKQLNSYLVEIIKG
ncbi:glycosyltransferase [Anaeromicropila herbilytica]|uniref:Glycosyltransferase n=1 Tax=Anaeromicropila herbilytica TaxID=2785025 RepID=A0A7R7EHX8_9FIRM|nr:glycosyltransferase [Anaeromicropila herbilytica]BCN29024.1 hypothetical protein bsdtb5_03190 [Anaeromicropila herbilytica]